MLDEPRDVRQADNRDPVPEGVAGETAGAIEDIEKLSFEELEKLVKAEALSGKQEETQQRETPKEEVPQEEEEEIPEDLKNKPVEELIKELVNLRKIYGKQANELGELRKWKEQKEKEEQERELWRIDAAAQKLLSESLGQMTDEEKEQFYEQFVDNPVQAIASLLHKTTYPLLVEIARLRQEAALNELRIKTRDSLIPFEEVEQEVYKIIKAYDKPNGGNELFEKYGTGAFEYAYNLYKQRYADEIYKRKLKEAEERLRQQLLEERKKQTYTESAASTSRGGTIDYENLPLEELIKLIPGYPKDRLNPKKRR